MKESVKSIIEEAGPDMITEGATNSDIDLDDEEEDSIKSPCSKCRPQLSRITTTSTSMDITTDLKPTLKHFQSPRMVADNPQDPTVT